MKNRHRAHAESARPDYAEMNFLQRSCDLGISDRKNKRTGGEPLEIVGLIGVERALYHTLSRAISSKFPRPFPHPR